MTRFLLLLLLVAALGLGLHAGFLQAAPPESLAPVALIFDTDMGNDIDDALALGVIHALQSRGECRLLAVTLSKDQDDAGPFCDLVNTFYGRGEIPIGVVRGGKTPEPSKYLQGPVQAMDDGGPRYPRKLKSGRDAPEAVSLLRQTLAAQPDGSVTVVVVGFSTNLARLLESPADSHSPLAGRELVARKCALLSMMAGMFSPTGRQKEYNVFIDAPAAKKVFADWPTPIVTSGFEVGQAIKYPASSIERDYRYVRHHPLREAYELYQPMPYDRETWDLTAVLYAVRPDRGYFDLSPAGTISVDAGDVTQFAAGDQGRHRYLTVNAEQVARVREALVQLASQPPGTLAAEPADLLEPGWKVKRAAADCKFTEGPAVDAEGRLYFSDGPNDRIMRIAPDGEVSVFRSPCGRTNGMKFDQQGRLTMCQSSGAGGKRRVARLEADGSETALAERFEGKQLNAPNDLTIDRLGRIYFTDIAAPPEGEQPELASGVYRIDEPGKVVRVIDDLQRPNGIVLTPDNRLLYVSDRGTQKLHRYEVQADGGLKPAGVVYDFSPDRGIDGMTLDADGNIWAAAGLDQTTGLWVVSPQGKLLLHHPMPEFSTNLCFAGDELRDLYFTAGTSVYHLRTMRPGMRPLVWK